MCAKRTITNILRTGEFSVALTNFEMSSLADYVGSVSGEEVVKDAMPYNFAWGDKARVPVLDASHCVFECKVSHTHIIGSFHTFFGEVVNLHLDEKLTPPTGSQDEMLNWFKAIDIHGMNPLVYHSIQKYYRVGEKV